jgi:hypothetical protein
MASLLKSARPFAFASQTLGACHKRHQHHAFTDFTPATDDAFFCCAAQCAA